MTTLCGSIPATMESYVGRFLSPCQPMLRFDLFVLTLLFFWFLHAPTGLRINEMARVDVFS